MMNIDDVALAQFPPDASMMMLHGKLALSCVFLSFVLYGVHSFNQCGIRHRWRPKSCLSTTRVPSPPGESTKNRIAHVASWLLLTAATTASVPVAQAKVFIDTDLYGDKELKIATINKLKQKLRDAIIKDPSIAPCMLELSINDALGFDVVSEEGGPDGSIQYEVKLPGNDHLQKAVDVVSKVKKELQRTNTVGFADIVAFGGAEALESAECTRITVQIGRDDAKVANKVDSTLDWRGPLSSVEVRKAFEKSGLSVKEAGLLIGSLGELRRVVDEATASIGDIEEDEGDKDLQQGDVDFENLVPSTFGSRDKMYGKKIGQGNFGTSYLQSVAKGKAKDNLQPVLTTDPQILETVKKYAGSSTAFQKDVAEAYLKLTLLGQVYSTRNS